jgi:hypothetical protein
MQRLSPGLGDLPMGSNEDKEAFWGIIDRILRAFADVHPSEDSNALLLTLNNTAKNMFFLPCWWQEKHSADQIIDSFFVRTGDGRSAVLIFPDTAYLHLAARSFGIANVIRVIGWLVLAVVAGGKYRTLTESRTDQVLGAAA